MVIFCKVDTGEKLKMLFLQDILIVVNCQFLKEQDPPPPLPTEKGGPVGLLLL